MKTITGKKILGGLMLLAAVLSEAGCSSSGSSSSGSGSSTEGSTIFPSSLAISSPFGVVASTSSTSALTTDGTKATTASYVTYYAWATGRIDLILAGTTPSSCRFDPGLFLRKDSNAGCFGPFVPYENHPDAIDPADLLADGTLPTGDVGIWTENDAATGNACAAAELNARMEGVQDKSLASLMGLASLICAVNTNGLSLPAAGSTLDLTAEMNALGISDVTFNAAQLTNWSSTGIILWNYALDFDYSPGGDTHTIVVALSHMPGSTAGEYRGRLSYLINDSFTGGNCPSIDVTDNGSLLYERNGSTSVNLEVRTGQFCEHGADGQTDGLVDPSLKYNASSRPTGWGNNFGILTANYNPQNLEGDYAYSWQAGPMDSNSRVFNIHVEEVTLSTATVAGANAYYGYGSDISATDGGIDGFICNWTGPNNNHTVGPRAQSQTVVYDSATGLFTATDSSIAYAPTTACDYDGTGTFTYDSDVDGAVNTDPATPITNDLVTLTDADGDGNFDEIAAGGFSLPAAPANL